MTTASATGVLVNDIHSQLNLASVARIAEPATVDELRVVIAGAVASGESISIAGGRHAMGGQQFADGSVLVDMRQLDRVVALDADRGLVTVEAGIQWPALVAYLHRAASSWGPASVRRWGIVQKQTGADRLSLGGALACNAHGRGLTLKPIVDQVESFDLLDAAGALRTCSRASHPELFRLAIGGYGLFGVITRVTLRLRPRVKVRRVVDIADASDLADRFEERIRDGFLYGDFQFAIDAGDDRFLRRGVFSCYEPVPDDTPLTVQPAGFTPEDWSRLIEYAHTRKGLAFDLYSSRYLETSGQIYWADSQLAAFYLDRYHDHVDRATGARVKGSEMITEVFVPRAALAAFLDDARVELRARRANVVYGTVRLIERDDETFLAWARDRYACIVFNLHVDHTAREIERAADAFRALIDLAIAHGGSYYLTYHRWARPDQVETCYPQMREVLARKRLHDPREVFQSNWYRHCRKMFR